MAATLLGGCAAAPSNAPTGTTGPVGPVGPVGTVTGGTAPTSGPDDTPTLPTGQPTGGPSSPTDTGASCPARPTGRGSADNLVIVAISGPATAPSGSTIAVSSQLVVLSNGPRVVLTAHGSSVEVLRGSTVVARTPGPGDADVPLPLTAGSSRPGQTLPTQVPLVGCDGTPLPPGSYRLRAVVAYGADPLNGAPGGTGSAGQFVLVSDPPVELTIT